jgi:hypothetical protein
MRLVRDADGTVPPTSIDRTNGTRRALRFSIPTLVALLLVVMLAPTAGAATLQGQVIGAAYPDGAPSRSRSC